MFFVRDDNIEARRALLDKMARLTGAARGEFTSDSPFTEGKSIVVNGNRTALNQLRALTTVAGLVTCLNEHGEMTLKLHSLALDAGGVDHYETVLAECAYWRGHDKPEDEIAAFLNAANEHRADGAIVEAALSLAAKDVFGEEAVRATQTVTFEFDALSDIR